MTLEELLKVATPGPWVPLNEPDGVDFPWSVEQEGDGFSVCGMYAFAGKSDPQEANARLIALAPTLAAALIEADRALANLIFRYDEVVTTPDCSCGQDDHDVEQARATLASIRDVMGGSING